MTLSVAVEAQSPQQDGGSARLGTVWGVKSPQDGQHKSPEMGAALRKSQNSGGLTPTGVNPVARRRQAAEFIKQCTGEDVPYSNDLNFRQTLSDGRLLCTVLSKVYPLAMDKVEKGEAAGRVNLPAFFSFMDKQHLPSECRFSQQDLLSEDYDDRPRIAEYLLQVQNLYCGNNNGGPSPLPPGYGLQRVIEASDVRAVRDSPRKGGPAPVADLATAFHQQHHQQQRQMSMVPTGSRTLAAVPPNASFANLCSDISRTLMSRLQPGMQAPVPYDTAASGVDVRAVMEQFLNGLSVEYERRLLTKDQELTASKDALAKLNKQMDSMRLDGIRTELEGRQMEQMQQQEQESKQQLEEMREELELMRQALQTRSAALEVAHAELGRAGNMRSAREAQLEAELEAVAGRVEEYETLKQRFMEVREENKKLYNTVQDLKGSIRVFCRVRPLGTTGDSASGCLDIGTDGELAVYDKNSERKIFKFDRVFGGDSSQEAVYEDVQTLIRSVMDGFNVCIFAYGQTGSGKTHTMTGSNTDNMSGRGINYRALDDLFALRQQRDSEMEYDIQAQMLEIYNESIRDLLIDDLSAANKLELLSTQPSGLNVPGARQVAVSDTAGVLTMMRIGARNRHSAATQMNDRSSRSHQVLTIIVDGTNRLTGARTHACLHLVDLAGSERTDKSGVEGDRLREANSINTSLSALGTVMHSLAAKSRHIPFRNSKLTELLQDSLSGNAKVCMLMHVAPESSSHGESVSTLNFGNRVAAVTLGQAKQNVESGKVFEAHELLSKKDRTIEELRRQLSDQASTMHSLRSSGDTAPPLSARSSSFLTAHTHTDAAVSTPGSHMRTSRPANHTPRGYGYQAASEQGAQTPRSQSMRSPAPPLPLAGLPRLPPSSGTPRTSAHGSASTMHSMDQPAPATTTAAAAEEQLDRLGPLNAVRGGRGQQQPGASTTAATAGIKMAMPALGRSSSIPKIDTASTRPSAQLIPSGSMSARTSSRYGTSTSAAAPQVQAAVVAIPKARPATSRTSGMYSAFQGPISRSTSVVLAESAMPSLLQPAKACKPPLSSRPSGGWKS